MKILVSACLLGNNVRWNGANKKCDTIMNWADEIGAEIVPVCPENDLYGTPRGPIRLVQINEKIEYNLGGRDVHRSLQILWKCPRKFENILKLSKEISGKHSGFFDTFLHISGNFQELSWTFQVNFLDFSRHVLEFPRRFLDISRCFLDF